MSDVADEPAAVRGAQTPAERVAPLVERIRVVNGEEGERQLLADLFSLDGPTTLGFVNAHAVNLAWTSPPTAQAFADLDILLRDGIGIEILYKLMGRDPGLNMNGTDLIPRLVGMAEGRRIALFGAAPDSVAETAAKWRENGADIADSLDGFRDEEAYVAAARSGKPDMIVLAMGMPKQEQLAATLKQAMTTPCLIVCGGAIFDFTAGKVARAPEIMRRLRLEWLFRLMLEPKRLFGRYVIGIPVFFWRAKRYVASVPGRRSA